MKICTKRVVVILFSAWILHEQIFCKKMFVEKDSSKAVVAAKLGLQEGLIRATFILKQDYLEKIKAYAYWERLQIKDVFDDMCEQYFKDKMVFPIPEKRK